MPVINIPENELAYNAFFSLHRPLLGLSSKPKRSFFSSKSIEEEQEAESDEALFQYMSTLEHFVEPSTPGTQNAESSTRPKTQAVEQPEFESTLENTISIHTEYDDKEDIELLDPTIQTQIVLPSSLPIYRMPPSSDIVDFLSTIESKMNQENMLLKEFQKSRSKKLEILNNSRHYRSPRFYTSGSRRFHQKGKQ